MIAKEPPKNHVLEMKGSGAADDDDDDDVATTDPSRRPARGGDVAALVRL